MKLILVIHVVGQTCYCSDCLSGAGFAANTQESTSVDPQARPNGHSVASDRISNQEIRYDQEKKETPVCHSNRSGPSGTTLERINSTVRHHLTGGPRHSLRADTTPRNPDVKPEESAF